MFRQILVAIVGAVAAQLTAATLTFSPSAGHEHYEAPRPAVHLAIVPGSATDIFSSPILGSSVAPFLGASQIANGH